jgi:hypothetical protein
VKQKEKWCDEAFDNSRWTPNNSGMWKSGWKSGFEFARKEATLTSNFNGPCSPAHCDCQKVITEAIQVIGEKESGSPPVGEEK